ncbi:MAG: hypothetical protein WB799_12060 [Candidatus Sulfotelmatobacter sp.]
MANRKSNSKKKKTDNGGAASGPPSEREARVYVISLDQYIRKHEGEYLRGEDGSLHLAMGGRRIPLSYNRENYALARLMLDACNVSTISAGAQAAIQRLQVVADAQASGITLRQFSAFFPDHGRLYIPVEGGELLRITSSKIQRVPNGRNEDRAWVEHPEKAPFRYRSGGGVSQALQLFERLVVDTQSCRIPEMRWLVAMHEGFFPYVRECCRARFLLVHIGATQQGKTSGAQRFTQLHGLGEVKGDYSVAALGNMPDPGLLVLDNREQINLTPDLIDFLLFLATGAQRARSTTDGRIRANSNRPAAVLTSIEGVHKPELQARCVEVEYAISNATKVDRDEIEGTILKNRHNILSATMQVLQAWLKLRENGSKQFWDPCPRHNFERHLQTLAELLCAYGEVAGKPAGWADEIISGWGKALKGTGTGTELENELEYPLRRLLMECPLESNGAISVHPDVSHGNVRGTLYVSEVGALLDLLRTKYPRGELSLPRNATGLGRRLRSAEFSGLSVLDEDRAPLLAQLRRTAHRRPIGLLLLDDDTVTNV